MKETNKENLQYSKSSFLQKFAGKINFLTKEGQIKDEYSFKLPIINSPQSNRASTMKFRSSKASVHSFFSDARTEVSLSSMDKSRGDKFLKSIKIGRHLTEISNQFGKHPSSHALKKSGKKSFLKQKLTAIPFNKKQRQQKSQHAEKQQSGCRVDTIKNNTIRNGDYLTFLDELNSVSRAVKIKKDQSHVELNSQSRRKYQK